MNAIELYVKDGRSASVWYCSQCRVVHRTEGEATKCCEPYKCDRCGKEIERYHTRCDDCHRLAEAEKEAERFDKAEKLNSWDGWVYCEGLGSTGFFENLQELKDECFDEEQDFPKYVWACKPHQFVNANLADITERICDNAYEDFDPETLNGLDELEIALGKFNQANVDKISYDPDYTKAVLL